MKWNIFADETEFRESFDQAPNTFYKKDDVKEEMKTTLGETTMKTRKTYRNLDS